MRLDSLNLNVPITSPANGTAQSVRDLRDKTVQIMGTFSASYDIEVSCDGTNFVKVYTGITAPAVKNVAETATHIRIVSSAFTSGTPSAVVNGFNVRVDGNG